MGRIVSDSIKNNHSVQEAAMMNDLACAMALLATTRRRWWPNRTGELCLQPSNICPPLLQLLVVESRNNPDPKERQAIEVKCTHDHIWATRAAAICTEARRLAKQMTRQSNFDLREVAATPMYTRYVGRRSQSESMYEGTPHPMIDVTEYRAGGVRLRVERMCMDEIRAWLLKLGSALKFCIEQERGRNEDETPIELDKQMVQELTVRLARRAVGACASDDSEQNQLSDAAFRTLVETYAKVSPELASSALAQTQESLQWLIQLCECTPHSIEFRQCLAEVGELGGVEYLNTRNGLDALRRITRQTDTPSELRNELSREGPMSAADDALASLALALRQTSSLRLLQTAAWHVTYAKLVGFAARQALIGVNRQSGKSKSGSVTQAPFMQMVKPRKGHTSHTTHHNTHTTTTGLVDLPAPRHVRLKQTYTLTGPQLLLASERLGLTPKQILSNCMIDVVWELIGTYEELPALTVTAPLAHSAFEVARHEAVLVIDTIAREIITTGTVLTKFVGDMRQEMLRSDGEFTEAISAASYALRSFSFDEINQFLRRQSPESLLQVSEDLMGRLGSVLGTRPMRNDKLPSRLMAECGMIVPEAVCDDQYARLDVGFSSEIYYPRLVFDLLSYLLPSVCSLRMRTHQRRSMEPMPLCGLDPMTLQTLHCGLAVLPKARNWMINLKPNNTESSKERAFQLGLTVDDIERLPPDVQTILQALMHKNKIRWSYRSKGFSTLEVPRTLLAL